MGRKNLVYQGQENDLKQLQAQQHLELEALSKAGDYAALAQQAQQAHQAKQTLITEHQQQQERLAQNFAAEREAFNIRKNDYTMKLLQLKEKQQEKKRLLLQYTDKKKQLTAKNDQIQKNKGELLEQQTQHLNLFVEHYRAQKLRILQQEAEEEEEEIKADEKDY